MAEVTSFVALPFVAATMRDISIPDLYIDTPNVKAGAFR